MVSPTARPTSAGIAAATVGRITPATSTGAATGVTTTSRNAVVIGTYGTGAARTAVSFGSGRTRTSARFRRSV